jgi:alkanesulfonate monooxygenase SsuD/methylene tetrahydromethanopterin reductase-like flavin-dependent oxidoreductase (luciferase family)
MMQPKTGIEFGIRAPLSAIKKAATITDANRLDFYFVAETHPNFAGVDALEALYSIASKVQNTTLGTGIVNVYSRNRKPMLEMTKKIYQKSDGRFVLGIGTSAPVIVEKMYKKKFERPLARIKNYTNFIKNHHTGPVYWAAVGDRMTGLAAEHADGVVFFLKPESEIRRSVKIIKNGLAATGRDYDKFNIVSIRPTYLENAKTGAKITIAGYVGANEFYSRPLEKAGYKKEVRMIRQTFARNGLHEAARHVSDKMVLELATFGSIRECAEKTRQFADRTKIKTVIAGFDLPKDAYGIGFFKNLEKLAGLL